MIDIVPAILVKTRAELDLKVRVVEPFVDRIQIDVIDGRFAQNWTVQPEDLQGFETGLMKEAHLMVNDNEGYAKKFIELGFDMIIVHCESCKDIQKMIKTVKGRGRKMALAFNPQTPVSAVEAYLDDLDMVVAMTVNPGFTGQKFDASVMPKVRELRRMKKDLDIEVDGGMKVGTIKIAAEAGANIFVVGSSIYGFDDKKKAIESLKEDALSAIWSPIIR